MWPEELDRYQRLDAAITLARKMPPTLFTGDASKLLPGLLASIPADQTVCLWHSYALNQGPASVRECIEQQIIAALGIYNAKRLQTRLILLEHAWLRP
jgi:hypothetical protein